MRFKSLAASLSPHTHGAGYLFFPQVAGSYLKGLGERAAVVLYTSSFYFFFQISQVLGNEIKFAVREPIGLR